LKETIMFRFGVDYYPEHWPPERWPLDAQLMQEAGLNTVRLAEFAWSKFEPEAGRFQFDWLDQVLEILQRHDIQAVLGTPTASPPAWLMTAHPDIFLVCEDGRRVTYGNRRGYCPNNPVYRDLSGRIVAHMADHYAGHPAVIGWQIDNEFGCHHGRCYCPVCQAAFQDWLRRHYGTLDALNDAWGTIFWSHTYTDWAQIPVPLQTGGSANPGLWLDYTRFMSDSFVAYQQQQIDLLRARCPRHFITHNLMGLFDQINYFDLAAPLDFVAWDNYPRMQWNFGVKADPIPLALGHAIMRGLKGKNFWVMEQQSGSGGWELVAMTPRPGELRLWTYQAIAHGADAVVYFRWRTARSGTEQYWHGVLDHDAKPRRRYREVLGVGAELQRIGEQLAGAESRAEVAVMLSYDTRFAFQLQPNHPDFSYNTLLTDYYRALHHRNIGVNIVAPTADLSRYKLVIVPAMYVLDQAAAANLRRYVENGGTLLTTARTGVKDETNTVVNMALPGLLAEVCGVEVDEYDSLPGEVNVPLILDIPGAPAVNARLWCDVLTPTTAQVIARYQGQYYAGQPAVTLNKFGRGRAVYVGTLGEAAVADTLVGWLVNLTNLTPALTTPDGVEAVERWQGSHRLLFLLNHADERRAVTLPQPLTDLLTGRTMDKQVTLAPKAVLILAG
jgi:beta-galactosidase